MKFWVDIENASGTKQGPGPIHTAINWQQTRRLNRAGNFSFGMPAVDDRAQYVTARNQAACMGMVGGEITELGRGVIDKITTDIPASGEIMLSVAGDDLLRELRDRHVGQLEISATSASLTPTAAIMHDPTAKTNTDLVSGSPLVVTSSQYIYVGFTDPFTAWTPSLSAYNTNAATLAAQYLSNNEEWGSSGGWATISVTDGTASGGAALGQAGSVSWTAPGDWEMMRHNDVRAYWIRFQPSANTSSMTFTANAVTGPGPATTGPADIIAFAPSGWSLDTTTGYNATNKSIKWQFDGESVLEALVKLAELTGERFRLGSGRKVVWLQTDQADSGVRAVRHTGSHEMHENDLVCLIVDFREASDAADYLVGRIYCRGNDETVTLATATATPPTGYTLGSDSQGDYLQHDATWSSYGINRWMTFSQARTADELYEAVYEELAARKGSYSSYDLTVTKLERALDVGDTIRVEYRRIVGSYVAYDIDDDFVILEARNQIDQNGRRTVAMRIASAARWPDTDEDILARLL